MDVLYFLSMCVPALCLAYACHRILEIFLLRRRALSLGLPMFRGPPILGNCLELVKNVPGIPPSVFTLEVINGYRTAFKDQDLFMFSIGPYCYVGFAKPNVIETLLSDNKQVNKSTDYLYLHPWLGTGLLTSSYQKWKKLRRKLTPAFHFRILNEFQPVISDCSDVLVKKLRSEVGKDHVCLEPFLAKCTLDIIAGTALGVDVGAQKSHSSPYVHALNTASNSVFIRIFSPWLWPDIIFKLSPCGRAWNQALKEISSFIRKVIREKKEKLTASKEEIKKYFEDSQEDKKIRRAFLEIMLMHNMIHEDDQFSDQDIEDEVNTFTFAGHDTTTSGINWTLYLIGLYPEVQEKIFEEVEEIFGGDRDCPITLDDVKKMHYVERVIKESQRLYPSVPYFARTLNEDYPINGVVLPKGVTVMVAVGTLHRDPNTFPDPEKFDPDRFLITNSRHPFSYIPFSAGPRNCIGQRLAMLQMKTVVASLVRNYKLTSLDQRDKVLICSELVSRPAQPIRTRLELRP